MTLTVFLVLFVGFVFGYATRESLNVHRIRKAQRVRDEWQNAPIHHRVGADVHRQASRNRKPQRGRGPVGASL